MDQFTCVECGSPMRRHAKSLPQGRARCHPCRKASPSKRSPCVDCALPAYGTRCRPCADRVALVRDPSDPRVLRLRRDLTAPGLNHHHRRVLLIKWKRQGRTCSFCPSLADTVDHVLPLVRGGTNHEGNLIPCCRACNSSKGARTIIEWRMGKSARKCGVGAFKSLAL